VAAETWAHGDPYEAYVGRWSRLVAAEFVQWLGVPRQREWLDVGCGTGALTATVLAEADPSGILGIDPSDGFLASARARITDRRATFRVGDAQSLPVVAQQFDVVVSALVLNFVSPDPPRAVAEFARVAKERGVVAAYVWDYTDGMAMIRCFWDAATELDDAAAEQDERRRFELWRPQTLHDLWAEAGLSDVEVHAFDVPTTFADFDDYWGPFLGGQGPAPGYVKSLDEVARQALRDLIRARLPVDADGRIRLTAKAWAVRGTASHPRFFTA
jgi:SAM-dependent methyltransferase